MKYFIIAYLIYMTYAHGNEQDKFLKSIQSYFLKHELVYVQKDGKILVLKETINNKAPKIAEGDVEFIAFRGKNISIGRGEIVSFGITLRILNGKVIDVPLIEKIRSTPYDKVLAVLQELAAK